MFAKSRVLSVGDFTLRQRTYNLPSKNSEPLCLRRMISELQQDGFKMRNIHERVQATSSSESGGGMEKISTSRATNIALKRASLYGNSNVKVEHCLGTKTSLSPENILKEKMLHPQKTWSYCNRSEALRYYKMWHSLSRDIQNRSGKRIGREQRFKSSITKSNEICNEDFTKRAVQRKDESLSTLWSERRFPQSLKNSLPGSRQKATQQVLPRIILPL